MRGGAAPLAAGDPLLDRFRRRGALLEGHFLLTSGLHSPVYFQSALLLQHPPEAERLARELAERLREALGERWPGAPPVVVAPALGGVVVGYELARALGGRAIFAERQGGAMTLRRGFRLEPAEAVVVCEDVITTGGSAREVVELAWASGAPVLAVAALVHRAEVTPDLGAPLVALARLPSPAYEAGACPLCAAGVPLHKPGSRGTKVRVKE